MIDISPRCWNISSLDWEIILYCLFLKRGLQKTDNILELYRFIRSQVEYFKWRNSINRSYNSIHNIINIRKVSLHLSEIEDINWFSPPYLVCKYHHHHIWTTIWTIHREESESGGWKREWMRICMSNQLIGFLGSSIYCHRMICLIINRKWLFSICPVYTGT